jgi:predicted component of type VI protein secretion system
LATVVFDDPSVEGIHAKLIRLADGGYLIRDQGSISGTWVNYGLVPPSGQRLANGDLVHLGRVAIRFRLSASAPPREIRIRPLNEPANSYPNLSDALERKP